MVKAGHMTKSDVKWLEVTLSHPKMTLSDGKW